MRRLVSGLQFRLVLLVLIALLPAVGLLYYNSYNQRQELTDEAWLNLSALVASTAGHLEQAVEGARELLTAVAELPAVQSQDGVAGSAALVHLNAQNPQYLGFGITDTSGRMFASSPSNLGNPDRSDRQWFKQAMALHRFSTSDFYFGRITGKPAIAFSYPVLNADGSVRVITTASLGTERIRQAFAQVNLPSSWTRTVIDGVGTVLVQTPDDSWLTKSIAATELGRAVLAQKTGHAELPGLDGVRRLYAFQPVAGADEHLFVIIGSPIAEALAAIDASLRQSLLVLFGFALLALLIAGVLSNVWVATPVNRLVVVADRLSEGDLKARHGLARFAIGELTRLAGALDGMAAKLESREVELVRSLTERQRITEALRQGEERFHIALDNMLDAVALYTAVRDERGRIVDLRVDYVNPAFSIVNGRSAAELVGQGLLTIYPPLGKNGVFDAYCRVIETGEALVSDAVFYRSGPPDQAPLDRLFDLRATKLGDGIIVSGRDVTQRVRAEEELRQSEERFRTVVEDQTEMIGRFSGADGAILFVNQAWKRFFGPGLPGKTGEPTWPVVLEEDRDRVAAQIRSLTPSEPVGNIENRVTTTGGEIRWTSWTNRGTFDSEGRLVGWQAVGRDVTERKEAEAAVRRLNAELEARVSERTADLQAVNEELQAFIYSVSHDLRSPLRAISGYSIMVQEEAGDSLDAECRRKLGVVDASARRLGRLVDGLLSLSRLGRTALRTRSVEMQPVVEQALSEAQESLKESRVDLQVGALPSAQADPELIRQVWVNLLSNAIKFSRPNGAIRIEVGGTVEGEEAVYYVRDHGVGFDMKYADKLFRVFERLHSDREVEGTGIGLALVKRIVERHGGRIWAEGTVGAGACFHFTLPANRS